MLPQVETSTELSPQAFCTFAREFPSFLRQGAPNDSDLIPERVPVIRKARSAKKSARSAAPSIDSCECPPPQNLQMTVTWIVSAP